MSAMETYEEINAVVQDAIFKIIAIRRKGNFPIFYDDYIEELEDAMVEYANQLYTQAQRLDETDCKPEYEPLTGHEMGVCPGRI